MDGPRETVIVQKIPPRRVLGHLVFIESQLVLLEPTGPPVQSLRLSVHRRRQRQVHFRQIFLQLLQPAQCDIAAAG